MSVHKNDFPAVLPELDRLIETRKIPNALLFTGHPGSGRNQAALWFARAANCTADHGWPCNRCRSCKKINANQHPDMILVAPAEPQKPITIAQIRQMTALTGVRPHEAAYRMVLITDAGQMNIQAQNALLKELEEPPENTFFILMARERSALLPTILSRCRSFRFPSLSGQALADHLCAHYSIDAQWARIAADTAGNDLNLAATLVNTPGSGTAGSSAAGKTETGPALDWGTSRPWLIRQVCHLLSGPPFRNMQTALGLSAFLSHSSERVPPGLAILRTVFRDLCVIRHAPEKLLNIDFIDRFQTLQPSINDKNTLLWMDELHETEKRLASNSSIRMTFDRFFLKLNHLQGSPL
ncbi:MAG: DNA polymerase III subunit delta' [Desulfotignum sp.]|nr:DNA polymerase III subunit delta' [Desulfotignum sp.]